MKINFVVPFTATKPSGGVKVMYEYANQMADRGHDVTIIHGIKQMHKTMKSPLWYKQFLFFVKGASRPAWYKLHPQIKSIIVPEISDKYIPDADAIVSTWWATATQVSQLSATKGRKYNLIQGYEVWDGHEDLVHHSYHLPVKHIAISRHLQEVVQKISGNTPIYIPNAVSTKSYFETTPIQSRKPASVCMMFSEQELKGSKYGLEALLRLKNVFPDLTVDLISVPKKPAGLPDWIKYNRNPSNIREIYNRNSIFLSPSLSEGWGLTCTEAMLCGCCLVCTDIGGHREFAIDGENACTVEPRNVEQIYETIRMLIENDEKRYKLSREGTLHIARKFSWEKSAAMLENLFTADR